MYKVSREFIHEHPAHSFILFPDDNIWNVYFEAEDLEEMKEEIEAEQLNKRFARQFVVYSKNIKADRHDNPEVYWIKENIPNYIELFYDNNTIQMSTEQDLLDEVYGFIKQSRRISGTRTETASSSKASANTKNLNRAMATTIVISRQASGDHADLVFMRNNVEIGSLEIGLDDNGSKGIKELQEKGLKTPRMMKDFALQIVESYPTADISKLEIPSLIISGMYITALKMKFNCGSVSLLSTSKRLKMPEYIGEVPVLLPPVLSLVYNYAQTAKETVEYIDDISAPFPDNSFIGTYERSYYIMLLSICQFTFKK